MKLPDRKNPRLKDFDYSNVRAYFITICTSNKAPFFKNNKILSQGITECLYEEKARTKFSIFVYCLMPDHMHLLVCPPGNGLSVSSFIGGLKSKTTRIAWEQGIEGKLWQSRFHDHVVRKKENLSSIAEYILNNPIRKALADKWQNYKYCGIIDSWM